MLPLVKLPDLPAIKTWGRVMIDALAFAMVALALGLPAIIAATMLGSKLKLD